MQASASLFGLLVLIGALAAAIPPEPAPPRFAPSGAVPSAAIPSASATKSNRPTKPPPARGRVLARPETTDGAIGISFEDLQFDPPVDQPFSPDQFTDRIRELLGKRVAIRGFIHPASAIVEKGLEKLILVREDQQMSFGPGAKIDESIVVEFLPGRSTDFNVRPITVVGTLSAEPRFSGGRVMTVYHLEAESATLPQQPTDRR